jgi:hypothetical protein
LNNLSSIIIILLAFALGFLIADLLMPEKETIIREPFSGSVKIDTIIKVIEKEPIILEKVRTQIIKQKDTLIQTFPFVAHVDTVIKYDTIKVMYEYPQNLFSLRISSRSDTLALQKMIITELIKVEKPWWEAPAYIAAGTVLGYILVSSLK